MGTPREARESENQILEEMTAEQVHQYRVTLKIFENF
jgi:hypothetical protein